MRSTLEISSAASFVYSLYTQQTCVATLVTVSREVEKALPSKSHHISIRFMVSRFHIHIQGNHGLCNCVDFVFSNISASCIVGILIFNILCNPTLDCVYTSDLPSSLSFFVLNFFNKCSMGMDWVNASSDRIIHLFLDCEFRQRT